MADIESDSMTSNKPYLLRAFFDWIIDNDCTPYVVVDAYHQGSEVPQEFVKDGQIVLNMATSAIVDLDMNNEFIYFSTRFSGVPTGIRFQVAAVLGIYARENGQGMIFEAEERPEPPTPTPEPSSQGDKSKPRPRPSGKPSLRVIK